MTNPNLTHIALILDCSGSMGRIKTDMDGGLTKFLQDQVNLPGALHVSITTFDSTVAPINKRVEPQTLIDDADFITPGGMTALNDGIGISIAALGHELAELPEGDRPAKVIVVIVTDGQENSSREYTVDQVKALVKTQTEQYQWEFVFLGANLDAVAVGGDYGIPKGSTITFAANAGGTDSVLRGMSGYVSKSRSGKAAEFSDEDRAAATE